MFLTVSPHCYEQELIAPIALTVSQLLFFKEIQSDSLTVTKSGESDCERIAPVALKKERP